MPAALGQRNALLAASAGRRAPRVAAGVGRRVGAPRHRADARPRRGRSSASRALRRHAGGLGCGRRRCAYDRARSGRRDGRGGAGERLWSDLERGFTGQAAPRRARVRSARAGAAPTARRASSARAASPLLAEREELRTRGRAALLLLDDVMSELDAPRRARLVELLVAGGQSS
jgi:DNA replication and repair protein RecF